MVREEIRKRTREFVQEYLMRMLNSLYQSSAVYSFREAQDQLYLCLACKNGWKIVCSHTNTSWWHQYVQELTYNCKIIVAILFQSVSSWSSFSVTLIIKHFHRQRCISIFKLFEGFFGLTLMLVSSDHSAVDCNQQKKGDFLAKKGPVQGTQAKDNST